MRGLGCKGVCVENRSFFAVCAQCYRADIDEEIASGYPCPINSATSDSYRVIWRISRPAYSMVRCGRGGLGTCNDPILNHIRLGASRIAPT
jgi:hypothetical protein